MDCQYVKSMLSALEDGHVVDTERRDLLVHAASCPECGARREQLRELRAELKSMPVPRVPARLTYVLRSLASKEASRRRRFAGALGRLKSAYATFDLRMQNLMRPLAVPAMGGLVSAVVLFAAMMTNYQGIARAHSKDVPTILATDASVRVSLDSGLSADEITVDVFVDEQGRVIDYAFPEGYGRLQTGDMRRKLENSLLFTVFTPATTFGQPTSGWVRVSFRRSAIDVQG